VKRALGHADGNWTELDPMDHFHDNGKIILSFIKTEKYIHQLNNYRVRKRNLFAYHRHKYLAKWLFP
jgi:hypothetical protein